MSSKLCKDCLHKAVCFMNIEDKAPCDEETCSFRFATPNIDILIPDLEDCPFCGRKATIVLHPGYNWGGEAKDSAINIGAMHGLWYVGCSYEFFEELDIGHVPWCHVKPAASWYAKLEDAIKHWNTRAKAAK